ncbi:MAG TPA: hypothetical protein VFC80_02460, partial [Sphaerochaeta sp.]|nr:hypothetical protein [Sphaerochaeta sp.]
MKESDSWHLRSIGEIPLEKVNKNLRELSTFMNTNVEVIRSIFCSYHPFTLIHTAAQEVAQEPTPMKEALLHYLQGLLPYAKSDGPTTVEVPTKEYKRLTTSFEELMRKSVRWVDNTALRLRSEDQSIDDELMLAFQHEGIAFLQPSTELRTEELIASLQYRLQPFNALIGEIFGAKLDGLIAAFKELATSEKSALSDWEVVANTSLLEADAHLLSVEMASLPWEEASHLLIDDPGTGAPPFVRLRSVYYAFDAHRLLRDGYAIIRSAVMRKGPEYAAQWLAIEETKCRLMPITFFTAIFGTMDWQRDVPLGESSVDALFERDEDRLLIQIPYAELSMISNPFGENEALLEILRTAVAKRRLAEEVADPAIIVDSRDRTRYRIEGVDGVLSLSFGQLATIGVSWEGIADIKDAVGLGLHLNPLEDELAEAQMAQAERVDIEGELESAPGSGSSYFTTFFEKETCAIEDAEEREEAEELVSSAVQPSLFDQEYSDLFNPDRRREDDTDEYESEAYEIIDPHVISEEWEAEQVEFSLADEEMEAGDPD